MVPLMERIAWQLCERVDQVIDVQTLFKYVWIHLKFILQICKFKFNNSPDNLTNFIMSILVSSLSESFLHIGGFSIS